MNVIFSRLRFVK